MKKVVIYILLAFVFFLIASFLFTSRYFIDGHLVFKIKGRISDSNNIGIADVRIYFCDVKILPNENKIEKEFIG